MTADAGPVSVVIGAASGMGYACGDALVDGGVVPTIRRMLSRA